MSNLNPNLDLTGAGWEEMYSMLHQLAAGMMSGERAEHTLSPTALVHEAFVRLQATSGESNKWNDKMHFRRTVVRVMRNVLVDHARKRLADKRGGGKLIRIPITLFAQNSSTQEESTSVIELEEVLVKFEQIDQRAGKVVELRLFGGLTIQEAAETLGVSTTTVENDWAFARAWLRKELLEDGIANNAD